jgi:hypothetical protein
VLPFRNRGLAVSMALGGWLLTGRVGEVVLPLWTDNQRLLLLASYGLALVAAVGWSAYLLVRLVRRRTDAAVPLLVAAVLLIAFFRLPLGPVPRELDEHLHRAAREDVVRRVEARELWPLNPPHASLVALVDEPLPVSADHLASVVPLPGTDAVQVVFFPYSGLGNDRWLVAYRSDDQPPEPPYNVAFDDAQWERLRPRWYRAT